MSQEQIVQKIESTLGSKVKSAGTDKVNTPIYFCNKADIVEVLKTLKETSGLSFEFLADLTAYDDLGRPEEKDGRFVVVYNLFSPSEKQRLRIKVRVNDGEAVPTATVLWKAANWAEREVWDMYGVSFDGHPDLRRILMDQRFEGHPQRKDYYWRRYQLFLDPEPMPEEILKG